MNDNWREDVLTQPAIGLAGWCRIVLRGGLLATITFGSLAILLLVRLIERPLFGPARPVTPFITQTVCLAAFWILGIGLRVHGKAMVQRGAVVANHASWLDIFALNAAQRVYFVSKSEVAEWSGIGWLARATGTVFIARKSSEAKLQQAQFEARLRAGHRLLFFPEGTSTDCLRVLPFKPTLFAAFYTHGLDEVMHIQPATVIYHIAEGSDPRFYGWWADMEFASHFFAVLAAPRQGSIDVVLGPPLAVTDFPDRKALSAACEVTIRATHKSYARTV